MTEPNEVGVDALSVASDAFDAMVRDRHLMGAEKYGPVKFLEIDSVEMALEEVADLANYARYTFIKLWLLRDSLVARSPEQIGPKAVFNPQVGD